MKTSIKIPAKINYHWNEEDLKPLIVDDLFCDVCDKSYPHLIIGEYKGYDILRCFNCRVLTTLFTENKEIRLK